jgi:hypothetical protein
MSGLAGKEKDILKNLKTYSKRYEEEDMALLEEADVEVDVVDVVENKVQAHAMMVFDTRPPRMG